MLFAETSFMRVIFLFIGLLCLDQLNAQDGTEVTTIEIGYPCPDFTLQGIQYYPKQQVSLSDFKGRWLILDFWSSGCSACVQSFPKINKLQQEFRDKIQFLLVGFDDRHIRRIFEKFRQKQGLELPVVYDTLLFNKFQILQVPYIVIIDERGIVRAITTSLKEEAMTSLLAGNETVLPIARNKQQLLEREKRYDSDKPLLIMGNGGNDTNFLFRSVLSQWDVNTAQDANRFMRVNKHMVQSTGTPLEWLYFMAYADTIPDIPALKINSYGRFWKFPIIESTDSSRFVYDFITGQNLYNYSLIVPPGRANCREMQEIMKRDLKNYFDHDVLVENRKMPCWKLVATDQAKQKLLAKKNRRQRKGNKLPYQLGEIIIDKPISSLICAIWYFHQSEPPIFDETGINGNIDLHFEAIMTDLEDIKKVLRKNGLDLVKGEKEMKVLVIRDQKSKE